jgi:GT2 family glycosyltransferase
MVKNWSSEKKPILTAVTLVYNKRDFCEPAIESLLRHKGLCDEDLEYVLWDQGSPYEGVDWYLEELRQRELPYLRIMGDGVNIGVGAALNRALEYTDSEYFLKLDDDCELLPFTLPAMVLAYIMAKTAGYPLGVLSADVLGPGKAQGAIPEVELLPGMVLETAWCVGGGAVLISRDVLEDIGPWREDRIYGVEDGDFASRAVKKGYRNAYLRGAYHISKCRTPAADRLFDDWKLDYYHHRTDKPYDIWLKEGK